MESKHHDSSAEFARLSRGESGQAGAGSGNGRSCLTAAEAQVLRMLVQCDKNQQIAERLHMSESTVRAHLRSLFRKLNARSRVGLAVTALRLGLLEVGDLKDLSDPTIDNARSPPLS